MKLLSLFILIFLFGHTNAYHSKLSSPKIVHLRKKYTKNIELSKLPETSGTIHKPHRIADLMIGSIIILLSNPLSADAKDAVYGILTGRSAIILHPITMFIIFLTTIYSAYLGLGIKRLRTIGEELKSLDGQLPIISSGRVTFPIGDILIKMDEEIIAFRSSVMTSNSTDGESSIATVETLAADRKILQSYLELDATYRHLSATRTKLLGMNFRDKHQFTGSILLGVGVIVSVLGAFNKYMEAGKLFADPHLFAGMGVTGIWAVSAALVPAMQKGNQKARIAHITLNMLNAALFAWEIPTGVDMIFKVLLE